jgi:hypothetical protein
MERIWKEAILALQLLGQYEENHSQNSQSAIHITFELNSTLHIFLYYNLWHFTMLLRVTCMNLDPKH